MLKKVVLCFVIVISAIDVQFAQGSLSFHYNKVGEFNNSSIPMDDNLNLRKPIWIPIVESISLNLALGAFNSYVTKSEFAKINFQTIKDNFETGFAWDADNFETNMILHPFHGSIYYNLSRSSGYGFWPSLGIATLGSFQWEYFMENEPPALNDWILTSLGGSMMGEVFYRISNTILDESSTGSERFWRELGAGIFNPGRLFNRLIYGRTNRINSSEIYEKEPDIGLLELGMNNIADGTNFKNGEHNLMLTFTYTYGDPFSKKYFKPFDSFRFHTAINFWNQPFFGRFLLYGILTGKRFTYDSGNKLVLGLFGHFDYINSEIYQFGGTSVGPGLYFRTPEKKDLEFNTSFHIAGMPMGAANSEYAENVIIGDLDSSRTYNMGPGLHAKSETFIKYKSLSLLLNYGFWWVHTATGAEGNEYIGLFYPKLSFSISNQWSIGLSYFLYHRRGIYDEYPDISLKNNEERIFAQFRF